ncbi:hypothetical protein [Providencia hangzhouensis]|uniref:hypothetical protein n=1 Tax=Providencia hangzhouensis TaxID=3031799 RepID=UPI0034DD6660
MIAKLYFRFMNLYVDKNSHDAYSVFTARSNQSIGNILIALNTHPAVLEHMPLGSNQFDEQACRQWVIGKEQHWEQYGYGVWAIIVDGQFAGWGRATNRSRAMRI